VSLKIALNCLRIAKRYLFYVHTPHTTSLYLLCLSIWFILCLLLYLSVSVTLSLIYSMLFSLSLCLSRSFCLSFPLLPSHFNEQTHVRIFLSNETPPNSAHCQTANLDVFEDVSSSVVGQSACNDFPFELRSLLMVHPSKFYISLKSFFVRERP